MSSLVTTTALVRELAYLFSSNQLDKARQVVQDAYQQLSERPEPDEPWDALFWISEYPNRVLPHEGQEEHAVELAEYAREALAP